MVNDLYCTFSIYRHMLEPKSWGDAIVIKTASVLWGIRITVLQSTVSGPIEHRFRHKKKLAAADLVLVFNGRAHGHYSACCEY